ncbi:hypothetical protein ACFYYN_38140 [Streptomyces sp. NPDC001902]
MVLINTQLLLAALHDPQWAGKLTTADGRGLSPLFWSHADPNGRCHLDMDSRLDITRAVGLPRIPGFRSLSVAVMRRWALSYQ